MNKKLIVLQDGNKDCGSASLLSIIRYYHGNISINKLSSLVKTTKDGTNFLNIKNAAYKIGLKATGYKVNDFNNLYEINGPFISQLIINNYTHFVVVYKIKKDKLLIMDPAKGKLFMNIENYLKLWTKNIMIFVPYKQLLKYNDKKIVTNILFETILKNKKIIFNVIVLSIIYTIISCFIAYYFQIVLDFCVETAYFNLIIVTLIFIISILYKNISNYLRNKLLIYLEQKLNLSLIMTTFNKILLLPYNYYKNKTTGEIISRINDIANIKNTISKIIITVFLDLIICFVSGIILFNISNKLFLFLIIMTLAYFLIVLIFNKIVKTLINKEQENNAKINSNLVETINGFETIKGLHIEKNILNKFEEKYILCLSDNLNYNNVMNIQNFIKNFLADITSVLLIFGGIKLYMNNSISLSTFLTFNFLSSYYLEPIKSIFEFINEFIYMKNSLKRANDLFEVEIKECKKTNLFVNGNIRICNLSFKYSNNYIFKNLNLNIFDKEKVLILGKSGSGKSTLLKIIFKYYNISRNKIFINNYDINDFSIDNIRENITYISQNEILFNDTIKNNIIQNRDISDEEFLNVVDITCVKEIISNDILGYDKVLEENAINISGGQRQRIILARALLNNSKIFLIDEGLNELDINLERKILKNIFNYYEDKTFIIVSHRLNNMDLYNKVLKFDENIVTDKNGDKYI